MTNTKIKYIFRMTHIDNIPHILKFGVVKPTSPYSNSKYVVIGDNKVIEARHAMIFNNINISECIPFYFGPRTPMLYVIQNGFNGVTKFAPSSIVYIAVKLDTILENHIKCIFTDGHALSVLTKFYPNEKLADIDNIVKYSDIFAKNWISDADTDLKRRKEAELLIIEDFPTNHISGFIVYDNTAKDQLISFGINESKIAIRPNYYF